PPVRPALAHPRHEPRCRQREAQPLPQLPTDVSSSFPSASLGDAIDTSRLAFAYNGKRALDGGPEFFWIRNRAFGVTTVRFGEFGVIRRRIVEGAAIAVFEFARALIGHPLQMHHLLVIAAVVMNDHQKRQLLLRGSPQHARR